MQDCLLLANLISTNDLGDMVNGTDSFGNDSRLPIKQWYGIGATAHGSDVNTTAYSCPRVEMRSTIGERKSLRLTPKLFCVIGLSRNRHSCSSKRRLVTGLGCSRRDKENIQAYHICSTDVLMSRNIDPVGNGSQRLMCPRRLTKM